MRLAKTRVDRGENVVYQAAKPYLPEVGTISRCASKEGIGDDHDTQPELDRSRVSGPAGSPPAQASAQGSVAPLLGPADEVKRTSSMRMAFPIGFSVGASKPIMTRAIRDAD